MGTQPDSVDFAEKHNSCVLAMEEQIVPKLPRYF